MYTELFNYLRKQQGVKKRFLLSFFAMQASNYEDALYQLSSVIDATAKFHYPEKGVGDRYKTYLKDNFGDLLKLTYLNHKIEVFLEDGTKHTVDIVNDIKLEDFSIVDTLYKIRNSLFNKKEDIHNYIDFTFGDNLVVKNTKLSLSFKLIMGLFFLLLTDEANKNEIEMNEEFDKHLKLIHNEVEYHLFEYAGEREKFFKLLETMGSGLELDYIKDTEQLSKINFSGISKRFMMAQGALQQDDNEESLYQLLTILEYLAKKHNMSLKDYLVVNNTDIYTIHTFNKPIINGMDVMESLTLKNSAVNDFAYIPRENYYTPIASIRNSMYHNPKEIKDSLKIVNKDTKDLVINKGDTVITQAYLHALIFIVLTDEKAKDNLSIHSDYDFSITDKTGHKYQFSDLIGDRTKILEIYS